MSASNDQKSIGLTLSGGGFRATLFHLGVVRYLYEQQMLHRVSHVCSVSGGSILSAHMVLNWDRYTGTEDQFNEAAREVVNLTTFDLRGYVIRRWLAGVITILPRVLFRQHVGRTTWLCRA